MLCSLNIIIIIDRMFKTFLTYSNIYYITFHKIVVQFYSVFMRFSFLFSATPIS